jgi:hypothetical protein
MFTDLTKEPERIPTNRYKKMKKRMSKELENKNIDTSDLAKFTKSIPVENNVVSRNLQNREQQRGEWLQGQAKRLQRREDEKKGRC